MERQNKIERTYIREKENKSLASSFWRTAKALAVNDIVTLAQVGDEILC